MELNFEEYLGSGWYYKNDTEFGDNYDDDVIWNIRCRKKEEDRIYTYDEAINLTGNGWYNIGLLIAMALAIQAMAMDMFGFSYVVAAAACDLQLSHHHTSFLLTVPLIGVIVSAYPWGYFSDTRGRKKCLTVALWGGFVLASLSAFSPNFTVLAVIKLLSSSLCSGALSIVYTLLGECCSARRRSSYLLIVSSSFMVGFAVYTAHAYVVLGLLDFTCDLGLIVFKPWRLLILSYASTLGCSAMLTQFFYESPKFLVTAGRTAEAVEILSRIKKWNRGCAKYPVRKIVLLEANTLQSKDVSLVRSLWDQTAPLFKPPLLQRSLLLFYITASIYSVNNGLFLWLPILFDSLFEASSTFSNNVTIPTTNGFCDLVNSRPSHTETYDCTSVVNVNLLVAAIVQGLVFTLINFGASMVAHKKKSLMILIFIVSFLCCFGMVFVTEKFSTLVLFFGINLNCISMSIVFTYFIELFPTRCRGMISCLGMMVGRASSLAGVTLIGTFTFTHCTTSLYVLAAYIFSAALMSLLLPPDIPEKSSRDSNYDFSL